MNEHVWLTTDEVTWLLYHAETVCDARKLGLFQLECARLLIDEDDGSELSELFRQVESVVLNGSSDEGTEAALAASRRYASASTELLYRLVAEARGKNRHYVREASLAAVCADLLRDTLRTYAVAVRGRS